jgi:hypothetical protein
MSTQAVLQEIKKHLAKGQTIASIRKQLVKEANQADNYGSAQIKFPSFSLMYTTNTNFQGGVQNKYGAGLYAVLNLVGIKRTVKLD